jgi:cytochrome P450
LLYVKELISDREFFKERGQEAPQSFGKYLLERQKELELSDNETAYLAGSMFGAGSDTTASAISISILAAVCFPEARSKVQEELDNVIGKERGELKVRNFLKRI